MDYKGYTITIHPDPDPINPRDDDNLGTIICFHSRYTIGDVHPYSSPESFQEYQQADFGEKPITLPIYLYDHSGITISTTPFSCKWDSCRIGVIICSKEKAIYEYGEKEYYEKTLRHLHLEVKEYDRYLKGEYVGFTITDKSDATIESCWGFSQESYAISDAKSTIDHLINSRKKAMTSKLKSLIKNHTPLHLRSSIIERYQP